jgi:phosphoribosylaminoimidazole-succinocarboxamide synthase
MAKIPQNVLDQCPVLSGLKLRGQGKVRDSYNFEEPTNYDKMLVVASDRCSIFDFVLNTLIPFKGAVLTALNYFWVSRVILDLCETDMVTCGAGVDSFLPIQLRNSLDCQKRATVVRLLPAPEVEDIVRLVLTGSGLQSYQKNGIVCGHKLPPGLVDGSLLPYPIYTPTTKAAEGHDMHITADSVVAKFGFKRERLAIQVASLIANYAAARGIRMADTKFEFSGDVLVDEKGTPDSSRFVDEKAWQKAVKVGNFPPSLDKQYVREWGKKLGIDKRDPENPEDVVWVHSQVVPAKVVEMTTRIYRYIFWRLTGLKLETFQRQEMGIDVADHKPTVSVVAGSESDLPQMMAGLDFLKGKAVVDVNVISCHRNPWELVTFIHDKMRSADIVIAGAGWAAALPGMVASWLDYDGRPNVPVLGVAFKSDFERNNLAAVTSIECLPSQSVELDQDGRVYFGEEGFLSACRDAVGREFLPRKPSSKEAKLGIMNFT